MNTNQPETTQTLAYQLSGLLGEMACGQCASTMQLATLETTIYHDLRRACAQICRQLPKRLQSRRSLVTMPMVINQTNDLLDNLCRVYDLPEGSLNEHRYSVATAILGALYVLGVIYYALYTHLFETVRQLRCLAVTAEAKAAIGERLGY